MQRDEPRVIEEPDDEPEAEPKKGAKKAAGAFFERMAESKDKSKEKKKKKESKLPAFCFFRRNCVSNLFFLRNHDENVSYKFLLLMKNKEQAMIPLTCG